jgi:hydrogenase nickel incorporation protein HypA/HybF
LSGVDPGALRSAYDLAREQSSFEQTRLVIEEVPLIVRCPACRADRPAVSLQRLCCGQCGAPTPEVVSGRELDIAALEIES